MSITLRPSSAARTVQCPASVSLGALHPNPTSSAAEEGTLAHAVAEGVVLGKPLPEGATEEMIEGAAMWLSVTGADGHFEKFGMAPQIHPENGGTPDHWKLRTDTSTLHINDYKFGHGYVEVFQNWQLINYAAIAEHAIGGLPDWVEFTIVQPRSFHRDGPIRTWRIKSTKLPVYFEQLRTAFKAALEPNARAYVGSECKYCPARHACNELAKVTYDACDRAGEGLPLDLPPNAVGRELQLIRRELKRMQARETGLAQYAESFIRSGTRIPGFNLEPSFGRECWSKSDAEVAALGEMMGVTMTKPALITPKQAIKAGLDASVVRAYSKVPTGDLKLVEDGVRLAAVFNN